MKKQLLHSLKIVGAGVGGALLLVSLLGIHVSILIGFAIASLVTTFPALAPEECAEMRVKAIRSTTPLARTVWGLFVFCLVAGLFYGYPIITAGGLLVYLAIKSIATNSVAIASYYKALGRYHASCANSH